MGKAGDAAAMEGPEFRGIQQVAGELGVTLRTIRFYEDKGFITPNRMGTTRIYTRREFARLQLVLRGKRLGFSLKEIGEFLDLYDADPRHIEQTRRLSVRVSERLTDLEKQKSALEQTIGELMLIAEQVAQRLCEVADAGEAQGTAGKIKDHG